LEKNLKKGNCERKRVEAVSVAGDSNSPRQKHQESRKINREQKGMIREGGGVLRESVEGRREQKQMGGSV